MALDKTRGKEQDLGSLASDPVNRTNSFAWGEGREVYFSRKKPWEQKSDLILDNPFVKSMLNSAGGKSDLSTLRKIRT